MTTVYPCPKCEHVNVEVGVHETRNRWGVKGIHVVTGEKGKGQFDGQDSVPVLHKTVEVIGASAPEQESSFLDTEARDYMNEYMEVGIRICRLKG